MSAQNAETIGWTIAAAAISLPVDSSPGSSIEPAARVGSSMSAPVTSAHAVEGRPLSSVAASQPRARSMKLRRSLGNESGDAFARMRAARLVGDRDRLELHLRLQRFAEAMQDESLYRPEGMRRPGGKLGRQCVRFALQRGVGHDFRDQAPVERLLSR